jgi:hypothetical protein
MRMPGDKEKKRLRYTAAENSATAARIATRENAFLSAPVGIRSKAKRIIIINISDT